MILVGIILSFDRALVLTDMKFDFIKKDQTEVKKTIYGNV